MRIPGRSNNVDVQLVIETYVSDRTREVTTGVAKNNHGWYERRHS